MKKNILSIATAIALVVMMASCNNNAPVEEEVIDSPIEVVEDTVIDSIIEEVAEEAPVAEAVKPVKKAVVNEVKKQANEKLVEVKGQTEKFVEAKVDEAALAAKQEASKVDDKLNLTEKKVATKRR